MFSTCGAPHIVWQRYNADSRVYKWLVPRGIGPEMRGDALDRLAVQALANRVVLDIRMTADTPTLHRYIVPSQWSFVDGSHVAAAGYGPYSVDFTETGVLCNCPYAQHANTDDGQPAPCAHIAAIYTLYHLPQLAAGMEAELRRGTLLPQFAVDLVRAANTALLKRRWDLADARAQDVLRALTLQLEGSTE